jgi:hypothetical protein
MTNKQLQALRKLFFLEISEAATHIAGVDFPLPWKEWEDGIQDVPDYIADAMLTLADKRMDIIEEIEATLNGDEEMQIDYYETYEKYKKHFENPTVVNWRLSQAIAAYFYGEGLADFD